MAVVAARVLDEILLVIIFRGPELGRFRDFGDDWLLPFAGLFHARFHTLRHGLLLVRCVEDC